MNELDLFADAIAIANREDRSAFLDRKCSGRQDLRQRLAQLLEAHANSQALFDRSRHDPNATAAQESVAGYVGAIIAGRYKLLEEIGDGGMGTVWMAEQKEPVKRLVAVKLIKAGMDSKAVLARFEAERQALALMDHPNIAKVHDAGTDDHGRPYFVMELVKGLPLTEYCDNRKLSVNERLDLFVQICSAVQHAHQKAIIHRDLKPSNVLVTEHDGKPVPKVIDFGLAKALNSSQMLTDRTLHTAYGTVVGTPLYMAPEQVGINALDVDTRTDIYALGVILYELLTGTTPLEKARFKEAAWEEVKRLIREEEPPRPSARLSTSATLSSLAASRQIEPAQLSRLIRGELDWIVMKSLEKDRTRRYETANGLAKDVQRYLTGDSVEACPPTLSYRLRKMYRRHRAAVGLAAVILGSLLVATVFSVGFGMVAARARAVAESAEQAVVVERDEAFQQRKQAEIERDAAQAARAELRRSHYLAAMSLIPAAWKADNIGRVIELLDEQRPRPGDRDDLRGFEWHYWNRLCRSYSRELSLGDDVIHCKISGDGSRAVIARKPLDAVPEKIERSRGSRWNYRIEIVDLATGQVVKVIANLNTALITLQLNHDGSRLVALTVDNRQLIAWDIASGRELINLPFDDQQLTSTQFALSPSGRRVAVLQHQGRRRLFDEPSQVAKFTSLDLDRPNDPPRSLQMELKGFASTNLIENFIKELCFNRSEDQVAFSNNPVYQSRFNPNAVQNEPLTCSVYHVDLSAMKARNISDVATDNLRVDFTPDGKHLTAVTAAPERIIRWDISNPDQCKEVFSKQLAFSFMLTDFGRIIFPDYGIQHSPDGRNILLKTLTPNTWIIDANTGRLLRNLKSPGTVRAVAFAQGGSTVRAIGNREQIVGTDYVMHEWDMIDTHDDKKQNVEHHTQTFSSLDGERQAVYRPFDKLVSIRNRQGKELHSFTVPELQQYKQLRSELDRVPMKSPWYLPRINLTFSRNGKYFCVIERKEAPLFTFTPTIYETESGKVCWSIDKVVVADDPQTRLKSRIRPVISPDQRFLALCGLGKVQIVSLNNPQERFEIPAKTQTNAAFSPDGNS